MKFLAKSVRVQWRDPRVILNVIIRSSSPERNNINSAQTEKELAEKLGVTQQAVNLHTMGKVQKEGRWIPYELSEDNKNRRH